ncbi:MAG: hypothetical protein HON04_13600 [Planctomicrobium sp.]|jgi:flagellar protein FliL|nr:hypothetical protein [Planctomicrobium sp.]
MANQKAETESEEPVPKSGIGLVGAFGFLLVAAIAGVSLPIFLPNLFAAASVEDSPQPESEMSQLKNGMTYVPFGEVTVNLDEGRMNRYLRIKMSLQVKEKDKPEVEELLTKKELILKNWLLSHLSDKTLDEIRGKAGQNLLRRELRTYFNSAMFTDGQERIFDILFEEFNVQ